MLRLFRNKKAQTTAEYAILIAIVVGALVAMQVYIRRGLQGRVRNVVDDTTLGGTMGDDASKAMFDGGQYEPYYAATETSADSASSKRELLGKESETGRATAEQTVQARQSVSGWDNTDVAAAQNAATAAQPGLPNTPDVEKMK